MRRKCERCGKRRETHRYLLLNDTYFLCMECSDIADSMRISNDNNVRLFLRNETEQENGGTPSKAARHGGASAGASASTRKSKHNGAPVHSEPGNDFRTVG